MSEVPHPTPEKKVTLSTYLHRNLLVAKAVGANANAKAALKRVSALRRPQKWLVACLKGIIERTEPLPGELAHFRNLAPDNPYSNRPVAQSEPPPRPRKRGVTDMGRA